MPFNSKPPECKGLAHERKACDDAASLCPAGNANHRDRPVTSEASVKPPGSRLNSLQPVLRSQSALVGHVHEKLYLDRALV